MEGPLSKWTNVMQGWQYRWFVLDENDGLLNYYTSKEKMIKGQRRGCVRLKGAVIGIDDEDESTFTITVEQKMFHFQARDAEERERWVKALEVVIHRHSGYHKSKGRNIFAPSIEGRTSDVAEFERRIQEADAYLQLMIEQIKMIEEKAARSIEAEQQDRWMRVVGTGNAMLESVKHTIVLLQICKSHAWSGNGYSDGRFKTGQSPRNSESGSTVNIEAKDGNINSCATLRPSGPVQRLAVPLTSYSSSDDEETYFDTLEDAGSEMDDSEPDEAVSLEAQVSAAQEEKAVLNATATDHSKSVMEFQAPENTDFDGLYDDDDDDEIQDMQEHGSVVMHLLSQVSVGMDLTKITLPTFILERRSLLEMYADFFAHPDLFVQIADQDTPEDRMVQVVKWYLSAFHAGRKSSVAKKPYNPILGETFICSWPVPGLKDTLGKSEIESVERPAILRHSSTSENDLVFIAEQVSHHPPISAFYAEHLGKRLQVDAHIWTKSKFLGLSIAVLMVGQGCVSVLDHDEEYILTFPNGYGRSILTTPWVELGGKCSVNCAKTGYSAEIEFLTKPFYGGKAHCLKADVFRPNNKAPFLVIKGLWNGVMTASKKGSHGEEIFLDVTKMSVVKKVVKPVVEQDEFESRRLWRHVTTALKQKDVVKATSGKHWLEQRQRAEAKERAAVKSTWLTKHFQENGEHWVYRDPLQKRIRSRRSSSASSQERPRSNDY